ncbi:glycosyltransferase [uncultured Bacteroides sp.]|uniref:glycosyltransferase n=1 Tax=uncultured Bacteroides sp. TaxID=162156 RepID=UPI002638434B|nr:glycosyltransferase [uncultured Bacteroides sp.]
MVHIICHDWPSTSGNHTGMMYLYKVIQSLNQTEFDIYILNKKNYRNRKINNLKNIFSIICLGIYFICRYKKGDKFLLTEYLINESYQVLFAKIIHKFHPEALIYAMIHLTPIELEKRYSTKEIQKSASYVSQVITLGSSLTSYLQKFGFNNIFTTFHYVDNEYYTPTDINRTSPTKHVIVMGAMARDFEQLIFIISQLPNVHFYVCKGKKDIDHLFKGLNNVTLIGYVSEDELKHYMDISDISLNVMKDTIGSNVICTSLAMGLAMIVSNVGSIKDYCDAENTIFCETTEDFILAIKKLIANDDLLLSMKKSAYNKAQKYSLQNYRQELLKHLGFQK